MTNRQGRVALGMSGGVDSSAAVAILQHHGYEVVGVTCIFQPGDAEEGALVGARDACARFGVEHVAYDCVDVFEDRVVRRFVDGYACGLTPSPCVGCNASTKIPSLLEAARAYDCDLIATGHYARIARMQDTGRFAVLAALDHAKDQSYMLSMLSQEQLSRLILPLGGMTKLEVRSLAADAGLAAADAPESQDICFAPHGYRELLRKRGVIGARGRIVNECGQALGWHDGLENYTVGQRRGIGVAGPEPYYVIGKRVRENELVVGVAEAARMSCASVAGVSWQAVSGLTEPVEAMVKLRYRSAACPCIIEPVSADRVRVSLTSPQPLTAPGQYAVFYQGSTVLGGGVIEEVG